jgi:hypothetical protein
MLPYRRKGTMKLESALLLTNESKINHVKQIEGG